MLDPSTATYPVWVQFKNVPLELLTAEGLSYLASALGTPLHSDQDCSRLFKGDQANVCINVDFSKPLQSQLLVDICGEHIAIEVSYSWKPQFCDNCHTWGHHALTCTMQQRQAQWVPKAKPIPPISTVPPIVVPAVPVSMASALPAPASTCSMVSCPESCSSSPLSSLHSVPAILPVPTVVIDSVAVASTHALPVVTTSEAPLSISSNVSPKGFQAAAAGVGKLVQQVEKPKQRRGRGAKIKSVQVTPPGASVPLVPPT
ncbi:hypothetical protein Tsubulata_009794 [Turnera subulata]|uniref:DUF4283 domain-containing protein n=1 Tax=Turnera subulata TaxID=218843 RepID=A0A9Q0JRV2_9ROSI|nr:hypothetical protein Tsubulata_009794 [Turnera subulata]